MDRATVYTSEQGRSVDFLFAQRATMIGLAKLSQAAFGSGTVVRGLAVTPNSPAALNVLVGIGEIYSMTQVDATTWGALPADTVDVILKQGLNMAAQTISTPAPTTSGYSINYLIEAQYQDQDNVPVVLPFYNSANPQIPLNGQGGGGATLPTERQGVCVIQAKAGIAATTGTQTTPSVDSGWTALAVVTVANGQSTVTSGNISVPAGVPQLTSLLQMMQSGSTEYAVDSSTTANAIVIALTPAVTSYVDGQPVTFKAANSNTGPCTINFGGGAVNLVGAAGALQGGEIVAGNQYTGLYSASLNEVVLNSQTAGALQVNPGTKSEHAMQLQQKGLTLLQAYTTAGTNTPTVPAGVFKIFYKIWGAGGGGGGGSAGAQSGNSAGSGSYSEGWMSVTPGQTLTAIVGANGTGGANTGIGGTNGGTSSLTNGTQTVSCTGGSGGSGGGTGGGVGGSASGGDLNLSGGNGTGPSIVNSAGTLYYGPPGGSSYGVGPNVSGYGTGVGATGRSPGGGGSGGAGGSAGAFAGGNGAAGAVYFWG